jgi:hypothetical protein
MARSAAELLSSLAMQAEAVMHASILFYFILFYFILFYFIFPYGCKMMSGQCESLRRLRLCYQIYNGFICLVMTM